MEIYRIFKTIDGEDFGTKFYYKNVVDARNMVLDLNEDGKPEGVEYHYRSIYVHDTSTRVRNKTDLELMHSAVLKLMPEEIAAFRRAGLDIDSAKYLYGSDKCSHDDGFDCRKGDKQDE